jgi:hypothetical protein
MRKKKRYSIKEIKEFYLSRRKKIRAEPDPVLIVLLKASGKRERR